MELNSTKFNRPRWTRAQFPTAQTAAYAGGGGGGRVILEFINKSGRGSRRKWEGQ